MIASTYNAPKGRHFATALREVANHPDVRIMRELVAGPRRYNELLAALPEFAEPLVGANLRELDGDGLVVRRVDPGPPLRVLYELTPAGAELAPCLGAIEDWARRTNQA